MESFLRAVWKRITLRRRFCKKPLNRVDEPGKYSYDMTLCAFVRKARVPEHSTSRFRRNPEAGPGPVSGKAGSVDTTHKVIVRKGPDGYKIAREAMEALRLNMAEFKDKKILIKPNAGRLAPPGTGINTNPEVAAAVLDFFLEKGIAGLAVGESPILGVKALESLRISGIAKICGERGVRLIDLDAVPPVTVKIPGGALVDSLKVCREALDFDIIVSVPVMKTHMHTQVSLGLKNMKGCLYEREKVRLHQLPPSDKIEQPAKPLDMAIADMSRILLPGLTVIDGTRGQEGLGPSAGSPRDSELVVASESCLAADWVAARLMGFRPEEIHHLRLAIEAHRNGPGALDIDGAGIETDPVDYMKWSCPYERPPSKISFKYKNVKVDDKDSCSACLSTVLMLLKRYYGEYADYFTEENPLRLALGKGIGKQEKNTILVGNCTIRMKDEGIFIKGCPPVASDIRKAINQLFKK